MPTLVPAGPPHPPTCGEPPMRTGGGWGSAGRGTPPDGPRGRCGSARARRRRLDRARAGRRMLEAFASCEPPGHRLWSAFSATFAPAAGVRDPGVTQAVRRWPESTATGLRSAQRVRSPTLSVESRRSREGGYTRRPHLALVDYFGSASPADRRSRTFARGLSSTSPRRRNPVSRGSSSGSVTSVA